MIHNLENREKSLGFHTQKQLQDSGGGKVDFEELMAFIREQFDDNLEVRVSFIYYWRCRNGVLLPCCVVFDDIGTIHVAYTVHDRYVICI